MEPYLILITLSIVGLFIHLSIRRFNFFKNLEKILNNLSSPNESDDQPPYEIIGDEEQKLEKITQKITNNFRILITIHGVLLAFIVSSQKIILVFHSWYFVIWCGLILATVIRGARFSIDLSDVLETKGVKAAKRTIYTSKKFYKTSLILLIINVALLPSIFLINENFDFKQKFGDSFHSALLISGVSISVSFSIFYFGVFRMSEFDYSYGEKNMIGMTLLIIVLGTIFHLISPTSDIPIPIGETTVIYPLTFAMLPLLGTLYFFAILYKTLKLIAMKLPERRRKWVADNF